MVIRVINFKGKKNRLTLLSKTVLIELREYFKLYKPKKWLFEGPRQNQYSAESVVKIVKVLNKKPKLTKP